MQAVRLLDSHVKPVNVMKKEIQYCNNYNLPIADCRCYCDCLSCVDYRVKDVEENSNRINDSRSPSHWEGLCKMENSQFCGFSEDGYYHGISVCEDCPYKRGK